MILKNSLLNAYSALGNGTSHLGLLISLLAAVQYPSDIPEDSKASKDCIKIYEAGILTHAVGFFAALLLGLGRVWEHLGQSVIINLMQVSVIFLNFYLVLIAAEVYIDFAEEKAQSHEVIEKLLQSEEAGTLSKWSTDFCLNDLKLTLFVAFLTNSCGSRKRIEAFAHIQTLLLLGLPRDRLLLCLPGIDQSAHFLPPDFAVQGVHVLLEL